jgi:hypothetical protein
MITQLALGTRVAKVRCSDLTSEKREAALMGSSEVSSVFSE